MKVIVFSGTRTIARRGEPSKRLDELLKEFGEELFIVHGDANGVDTEVSVWCKANGVPHAMFFAPWKIGRGAGMLRNRLMRDLIRPSCLYAYPIAESRGTVDCINAFREKGIDVVVE